MTAPLSALHSLTPQHRTILGLKALASPDGAAMIEAIRAALPQDDVRTWDWRMMEVNTLRWQRLAVLLNNEDACRQAAEFHQKRTYRAAPSVFDQHFVSAAVGAEWLTSRTRAFQYAILHAKADQWIATGTATSDYAELMDLCRRDADLRDAAFPMIADFDILSGNLSRLADTIAAAPGDIQADMPVAFAAAHALLSGNVVPSVPLFSNALKLHRKATRKRKGGLPGYIGLLHLCALLAADDAALHSEIEALSETKEAHLGLFAIRGLLEMARNKQTAARELVQAGMAMLGMMPHLPPVSTGLLAVAAVLIDPDVARRHVAKTFIPLFRKIESSMPLAAGMLAEALERVAPDPAPYRAWLARPDREVSFRFTSLIAVKPPWERALESIEAMLNPARSAQPEPPAKTKRLVWLVEPASGYIQPLEQSLQARGWSAGRAVSLKRLHQGDPKLDCLDEFDRRAARTIHRSVDGWHGYGQEHFECLADRTLPALIGHPRVFDAMTPTQPVELVEGRPELVLSSDGRGFRLTLSHAAKRPGAFIETEAPGRWRVVVVDEKAVEAAAILSEQGIVVPKSARDRLVALARAQAPALPLRIDTADIEDAALEGNPAPVVRLLPLGDGLKISLMVRPTGAQGPHFLPGIGGRLVTAGAGPQSIGFPAKPAGTQRVRRDLEAEKHQARALAESCPSLGGDGPEWLLDDLLSCLDFLAELQALPTPPSLEWPEGCPARRSLGQAVQGQRQGDGELVRPGRFGDHRRGSGPRSQGPAVAPGPDAGTLHAAGRRRLHRAGPPFPPAAGAPAPPGRRHEDPPVAGVAVRDLLEGAASLKSDATWKDFTRRLDEAENWQPRLPAGFAADLREYQTEGFAWMSRLGRWGAGAPAPCWPTTWAWARRCRPSQ